MRTKHSSVINKRQVLRVTLSVVVAFVLLGVVAPAVAAQAPSDGSTNIDSEAEITNQSLDISLEPATATVEPGGEIIYEIVVSGATDGINGYDNLNITIQDGSVANFTGFYETAFDNPGSPAPISSSEIRQGGNQLHLEAALLDKTFDGAEEIVIAEATVTAIGGSGDETPVVVESGSAIQDLNSTEYAIGALENSSILVDPIEMFLEPASITAQPGGTNQAELVVSGATGGINGYDDLNVTIQDGSVANFTGFYETAKDNPGDGPLFTLSEIRQNGAQLYLEAALADKTFDGAENITIATVNITATGGIDNDTQITIADGNNAAIQDTNGNEYAIGSTGTLPFEVGGIDVNGDGNFATDTNDDGLLNDVDGDESFDIFDVQALFNNLNSDAVQNNPGLFNFNDDDDPEGVSIFDVQGLFGQVG